MKLFKAVFFLGIASLLCIEVVVGYNKYTGGFSIRQMISHLPHNTLFDITPPPEEEKQHLRAILNQPYRYLDKGCQFYAFESADGKYVLKFPKQKHLRLWTELNQLPMPSLLKEKLHQKTCQREARVSNLFSSCKLAYEELSKESGLLYVHLNHTPFFEGKICLIDQMGWKHRIELDRYEFILQCKAIPLPQVIEELAKREDFSSLLSKYIDQLKALLLSRSNKGIRDRDPAFVKNVAFRGEEAIFTDVGQFYKDPTICLVEEQQTEINQRFGEFLFWIKEMFPEHAEELSKLIKEGVSG